MTALRIAAARIGGFFGFARSDRDVADEIDAHIQMHIDDGISAGMSPAEARRDALLTFGGVESARERYREKLSIPFLEAVAADVRYGVRTLLKSRASTMVAILTLAVGIGANTAIFSLVNSVLLSPPLPDADRIVWLGAKLGGAGTSSVSTLDYLDWKQQSTVFESLAAWFTSSITLSGGEVPRQLRTILATPEYFDMFRMKPSLGRGLGPADGSPGRDHVAVISHELWSTEYGSDPAVVGRSMRLQGDLYTVVGVMNEGGGAEWGWTEVWLPLAFYPDNMSRAYFWLNVYGRLKPGVTVDAAGAEMNAVAAGISQLHADSHKDRGVQVRPLAGLFISPRLRRSLLMLLGAVVVVLLIGCVNISSLMLAKGVSRAREVAIRSALGGGRARIVRQLTIEHLVLAAAGGTAGLGMGYGIMSALRLFLPPFSAPGAGIPSRAMISMDGRVIGFACVVTMASGLLFGVAPSFAAAGADLSAALKGGSGRSARGAPPHRRFRRVLVATEVALATLLLVTSGVLLHSFFNLQRADTGFDSKHVITAILPMTSEAALAAPSERSAYYREVLARVAAVPAVRIAALTSVPPMYGFGSLVPFQRADRAPVPLAARPVSFFKMVTPSYFETLGLRVKKGRVLDDGGGADAPRTALINESFARYFARDDPLGRILLIPEIVQTGRARLGPDVSWTIVGVVADEQISGLGARGRPPGVYVNIAQSPTRHPAIVLRTDLSAAAIEGALRRAVAGVNRDQVVSDVRALDDTKAESILPERTRAQLLGAIAGTALLLSVIGIYGVTAYTVARQTREFGVRAALGASRRTLVLAVVCEGMGASAAGIFIGLVAGLALNAGLAGMLFGVTAADPAMFAALVPALTAVTALAVYVPARRAARIDPLLAIRED